MKVLKSVFLIFLIILVITVIVSVFLPSELVVSRSIKINATESQVWHNIQSYKQFVLWSPWSKRDTSMKQIFIGEDGGVGSKYEWSGNADVGIGSMTMKRSVEKKLVESELRMSDWDDVSLVSIQIETIENQTRVMWDMKIKMPRPMNVIMYIIGMKRAIEKDYDEGLQSLKQLCEK